ALSQSADRLADLDVMRRSVEIDYEAAGRRVHALIAVADALQLHGAAAGVGDQIAATVPLIGVGNGPAPIGAGRDAAASAPDVVVGHEVSKIKAVDGRRRSDRQW